MDSGERFMNFISEHDISERIVNGYWVYWEDRIGQCWIIDPQLKNWWLLNNARSVGILQGDNELRLKSVYTWLGKAKEYRFISPEDVWIYLL